MKNERVEISPVMSAPMRGLGDVIASATKAVGIKPCGGCNRRREALNKLVPFGKVDPASKG